VRGGWRLGLRGGQRRTGRGRRGPTASPSPPPHPAPPHPPQQVNEALERAQALAEAADEGLELDSDHASHTLKEIVLSAPPTECYAKYYDSYLHRLGVGGLEEWGGWRRQWAFEGCCGA
jgi:hypothetical protein